MNKSNSCARGLIWLMTLLLCCLAAGCGGGGDGGGGSAAVTPQTNQPTVIFTNPAAGATGVAINTKITASFSKAMTPATITATTFTLTAPGAAAVTGSVVFNATDNIATFAPTGNLPPNTRFTATITAAAQDAGGVALASNFVWTFTTGASADTTAPTVISSNPLNAGTAVPINQKVTAVFSEAMDPATITPSAFTVTGPAATPVPGTVTYAASGNTAIFTPISNLAANTTFTATISSGTQDLAGNALASNFTWTFTTGAVADTTLPTVISTNPADTASGVCTSKSINASFSKAMDPLTVGSTSFTLTGPGATSVAGAVAYNTAVNIATFTPAANLAASTTYTATIHGGAKDLAGNALASDKAWSFTTGTTGCGPIAPVALGAAAPFGNLGGTAGSTNSGTLTVIGGDIGSTATTASSVTGFHDLAGDVYTETGSNKGTVNGKIYTCTVSTLGPTSAAINVQSCAIANQAKSDAQTAFNNLSPASLPGGTDPGSGQLGGLTLAPGTYQAAGGSFQITGSDLTLDAKGDANAVWVFQTASTLTVGAPGAPRSVILINGAQAKNIFWQVGTSATINGAGGGTMAGTIIASSAISFSTVGNVQKVILNGRAVGLNASVTMTNTIINVPAP
ncbi:Ig-like domain-containing protein [Collimonas sp.]|jgi:hypothetical protein|uniref:Ig-like domain-containing protein n=1 Tax=Collimonas sp. TaxID=1963772 RepID=UPI002C747F9E|nr:Ig-like domain-containing protein [Collimonas sp.]HWW06789.1 Ig-like domain-containing protein [Collimonas sp.]